MHVHPACSSSFADQRIGPWRCNRRRARGARPRRAPSRGGSQTPCRPSGCAGRWRPRPAMRRLLYVLFVSFLTRCNRRRARVPPVAEHARPCMSSPSSSGMPSRNSEEAKLPAILQQSREAATRPAGTHAFRGGVILRARMRASRNRPFSEGGVGGGGGRCRRRHRWRRSLVGRAAYPASPRSAASNANTNRASKGLGQPCAEEDAARAPSPSRRWRPRLTRADGISFPVRAGLIMTRPMGSLRLGIDGPGVLEPGAVGLGLRQVTA